MPDDAAHIRYASVVQVIRGTKNPHRINIVYFGKRFFFFCKILSNLYSYIRKKINKFPHTFSFFGSQHTLSSCSNIIENIIHHTSKKIPYSIAVVSDFSSNFLSLENHYKNRCIREMFLCRSRILYL